MEDFKPLPVVGYTEQSATKVELVNLHKQIEEQLLQVIDEYQEVPEQVDRRWLALAKTDLEKGFMSLNRAVFQPKRLTD